MAKRISFTQEQIKVLRECVRIALEDGSIEQGPRRSSVIDAVILKLDAAKPRPRTASR